MTSSVKSLKFYTSSFITPDESELKKKHKPTKHTISPLRILWSIQSLVLCMFLCLVVFTAVAVWLPVFISAISSIKQCADKNNVLMDNLIQQFSQQLMKAGPNAVNAMWDQVYWDNSLADPANEVRLRRIAHTNIITFTSLAASFFGSSSGRLMAVLRSPGNLPPTTHVWNNGTVSIHSINTTNCEPGTFIRTSAGVLAYNSIWYKAALARNTTAWTTVFTSITVPPALIIGVGRPIFKNEHSVYHSTNHTDDAHLIGVAGVTFYLEQLSGYLKTVDVGKQGRLFILERTGYMIASNRGLVTLNDEQGKPLRTKGHEHEDSIISSTTRYITSKFGSLAGVTSDRFNFINSDNVKVIVEISIFRDEYGLDWIVVAALNYKEIYGKVLNANIIAGVTSACSLAIAFVLAVTLGIIITRPLTTLSKQLYNVADMEFDVTKKNSLSNLYEFSRMEFALTRMKEGLNNFRKYVPRDLVRAILRRGELATLGVESRELTVFFCDICNFTTMSENVHPKTLIVILQQFFTQANNTIAIHEGTVDKYIGDCVMAFWNSPNPVIDHEVKAIRAALDLRVVLEALNEEWKKKEYPTIQVRIGINTAKVLVGNVGAPSRMNFTALGDGVNVASRLEGLNNHYHTHLMIGEATYASPQVQKTFGCVWLDYVMLKGKDTAIHVYEVIGEICNLSSDELGDLSIHEQMREALMASDRARVIELCEQSTHTAAQLLATRLRASSSLYLKREDK